MLILVFELQSSDELWKIQIL